jgi:hypothetical protein
MKKPAVKHKREDLGYIIKKFVDGEPANWGLEFTVAKRLLTQFPRMDFWRARPDKKFGSLLCLQTPAAKTFLTERYEEFIKENPLRQKFEFAAPAASELEDDKVGESMPKNSKPKSLLEFLRKDNSIPSHDSSPTIAPGDVSDGQISKG